MDSAFHLEHRALERDNLRYEMAECTLDVAEIVVTENSYPLRQSERRRREVSFVQQCASSWVNVLMCLSYICLVVVPDSLHYLISFSNSRAQGMRPLDCDLQL